MQELQRQKANGKGPTGKPKAIEPPSKGRIATTDRKELIMAVSEAKRDGRTSSFAGEGLDAMALTVEPPMFPGNAWRNPMPTDGKRAGPRSGDISHLSETNNEDSLFRVRDRLRQAVSIVEFLDDNNTEYARLLVLAALHVEKRPLSPFWIFDKSRDIWEGLAVKYGRKIINDAMKSLHGMGMVRPVRNGCAEQHSTRIKYKLTKTGEDYCLSMRSQQDTNEETGKIRRSTIFSCASGLFSE